MAKGREVIVIGVIHGFTPKEELIGVLESIIPDQVIVEAEEVKGKIHRFVRAIEFNAAVDWAKKKGIKVNGFDVGIGYDYCKKGVEKELERADEIQLKLIRQYSWKQYNQQKYADLINAPYKGLIDQEAFDKREKIMLMNLEKKMIKEGKILILTGCAHLKFFQKHLKNTRFPFRR